MIVLPAALATGATALERLATATALATAATAILRFKVYS